MSEPLTFDLDLNQRLMIDLILPPNIGSIRELRLIRRLRARLRPDVAEAAAISYTETALPNGQKMPEWDRRKAAECGASPFDFSAKEAETVVAGILLLETESRIPTNDDDFAAICDTFADLIDAEIEDEA